jgi:hypothetical protein
MPETTFLTLPGEIRNQIYGLLLVVPPPEKSTKLGEVPPIWPSILAMCKQTYNEVIKILYGENTFLAHNSRLSRAPQLRRWLNPISTPRLLPLVRRFHIFVRLECDARFSADAARKAFTGIDQLTIEVHKSQFRGSSHNVLKLFEGVRDVRKAAVLGSISAFPEYARWLEKVMMSKWENKLQKEIT